MREGHLYSYRFTIGPARVEISSPTPSLHWPDSLCVLFEEKESGPPDLSLRIRTEPSPAGRRARSLTDYHRRWSLFAETSGSLRLEFYDEIVFQTRYVVRMDPSLEKADFFHIPRTDPPFSSPGWSLLEVWQPFLQWWLTGWLARQRMGLIVHGAAVSFGSDGLVFIGPSGAGKTTLSRWCRDEQGLEILSDERALIWKEGSRWYVTGTPWPGLLAQASPRVLPLSGVFTLNKAEENQIHPLSTHDFFARLIPEAFLPIWSSEGMDGLLEMGLRLSQEVPCGQLDCQNSPSIAAYLKNVVLGSVGRPLAGALSR